MQRCLDNHYFWRIACWKLIIQMKNAEKPDLKKKDKPALAKASSACAFYKKMELRRTPVPKKEDSNGNARRAEVKSPHSHTATTSNSKSIAGSSIGIRSPKAMQNSIRISPKPSIAEFNHAHFKKVSQDSLCKVSVARTPSKPDDPALRKVKEEVKRSLANIIKVYQPEKNSYLDVSVTDATVDGSLKDDKLTRSDFNFLTVVGEGGYGKVWKVEHHKTRTIFAMKEMSKALIIMKKSIDNVLNEMKILSKIKSPFIANMAFAFNDRDNLYLGMDFLPGGDLRTLLADNERLTEEQAKFLIACLIKAIQQIHAHTIFHRDIKPENLVLDSQGYLRLTDFGIARCLRERQVLDASGTPGYMAPEVLNKQVHSYPVDFYAVGIVCYEMMMGRRPYHGQNRNEIREAVLSKQHSVKKKDIPPNWSIEAADFINQLIIRQPASRLGDKGGVQDLKQHPWFVKYPWRQLQERKLPSPFKAKYMGPTATDRLDEEYDEAINQYRLLQRVDENVDVFGGYFYAFR